MEAVRIWIGVCKDLGWRLHGLKLQASGIRVGGCRGYIPIVTELLFT